MSVSTLRKEVIHAQEWVTVHGKPVLRRTWPAFSILLLLPGATGVFGGGNDGQVQGVHVSTTYAKEMHLHQPAVWVVTPLETRANPHTFTLRFTKEDFKRLKLMSIEPLPATTTDAGYEMVYDFKTASSSVEFTVVPISIGKTAATIQYGVDPPIAFSINTVL